MTQANGKVDDRLQRDNAALRERIAKLERELKLSRKHLRDSYMGAVLTGLASRWSWGDTSAARIAEYAERLVDAVMRQRQKWEDGMSVNQRGEP